MTCAAVRHIAVIGSGVVAWSAAAAFAARLPGVRVTVVEDSGTPASLADLVGTANPSVTDFHHDLRLDERALMRRVDAAFRLGANFTGWGPDAYFHTHGEHGEVIAAAPFHHHWLRLEPTGGAFADYSVASVLARAGRFTHPAADGPSALACFNYGLHLDPADYAAALRDFAVARGVIVAAGPARGTLGSDGRVAGIDRSAGAILADLYIDCIGALADAVAPHWMDWSHWLPVAHVVVDHGPASEPSVMETVAATATGWRMTATRLKAGLTVTADAEANGGQRFSQGRRRAAWTGNVVAIGDAAVTLEPLEGVALHLVHAHVDRIIAHLPGTDFAEVELADYNRQTAAEAERLRDFLILHYHVARRPDPMWRDLAATTPPATLAHDLALFRERGHLPVHDGESFSPDSWLTVLIGQGVRPRRVDPVAAEIDVAVAATVLRRLRDRTAQAVASVPSHGAYLAAYLEHPR